MKALLTTGAVLATAVAIAACGGSGGSPAKGSNTTVSARSIGGSGTVLVDSTGMALYTPDQEKGGKVMCTGSCTSIWKPLTIASGRPSGPGKLGTVERPDGELQVTAGGRPLYEFVQDRTGTVTGNGVSDSFGGRSFTWHVVTSTGTAAPKSTGSGGGAYGGY